MALDKRLKEDWIIALRSGEYEQCRNSFRVKDSFCCLSVLAHRLGYQQATLEMSDRKKINLTGKGFLSENQESNFIYANDADNLSFEEIAERIEDGRLRC